MVKVSGRRPIPGGMGHEPVAGVKVAPGKKVRTYPAGRICAVYGCNVRLSRYNASTYCSVHTPPDYRIPPTR
jgi:hypothetical protein